MTVEVHMAVSVFKEFITFFWKKYLPFYFLMTLVTRKRELAMFYSKLGNRVSDCNGCVKFKLKFNDQSLYTTIKRF